MHANLNYTLCRIVEVQLECPASMIYVQNDHHTRDLGLEWEQVSLDFVSHQRMQNFLKMSSLHNFGGMCFGVVGP